MLYELTTSFVGADSFDKCSIFLSSHSPCQCFILPYLHTLLLTCSPLLIYLSPRFGTDPVPALGLLFHPVLAPGKFVPVLALCQHGDPVLALGALFQNWVPNLKTKPNPKLPCHSGATIRKNWPTAGSWTLQHPSARTGTVPGWAPTCTMRYFCIPLIL